MKIYAIILTALLIIILLGCGTDHNEKDIKLYYWSSNNSHEIEFAKYITAKWNSENPIDEIKFQPVPEGQSSEEVILAAVVGKTTPDIYSNMWQGDVEAYAQAGVLIPLDTLDGFMDFIYARCDSSVVEEVRSLDGHIYQIPWKINPIMLIYNKNHLKSIGKEQPPKTYSDFYSAAEKFKVDKDGDGYIDQWFGYSEVLVTWWQRFFDFYPLYLAASGGAPLVKNNQAAFNNEHAVNVFKFLRGVYENSYFPMERLSARQDVFLSGAIVIRFVGPWEISHAERYKPEGFEYSFTSMPVPDNHEGPSYTYGDPKNIVIFNSCEDPELAWKFLQTLLNEDSDLKLLETTSQLPRRKNLNEIPAFKNFFEENPLMQKFAEQSKHVKGTDASPVLKEVFDLISQEYEACVVYGVKTPEQAIQDAADAVNLLFIK